MIYSKALYFHSQLEIIYWVTQKKKPKQKQVTLPQNFPSRKAFQGVALKTDLL